MSNAKKLGCILILIGVCLPTATLPFITEFKPVPELCLTSNFFKNMGNMIVVFGTNTFDYTQSGGNYGSGIPYRYLFSSGVLLACTGLGILVIKSGK